MRGKSVVLGRISEVNEGRPTGANDFFYPTLETVERFAIEEEFLYPGLMKTRGANFFVLRKKNLDRFFLAVSEPKTALRGKSVLKYISYGESLQLNRRNTYTGKTHWYSFSVRKPSDLVLPCGVGATLFCAINQAEAIASNSFTELRLFHPDRDLKAVWLWLNSAISWLYIELMGRCTLGGGMLKVDPIDYRRMELLNPRKLPKDLPILDREVNGIMAEIGADDRLVLDNIVFDMLRMTQAERDAVYEALIHLVEARLNKADSISQGTPHR